MILGGGRICEHTLHLCVTGWAANDIFLPDKKDPWPNTCLPEIIWFSGPVEVGPVGTPAELRVHPKLPFSVSRGLILQVSRAEASQGWSLVSVIL